MAALATLTPAAVRGGVSSESFRFAGLSIYLAALDHLWYNRGTKENI